MRGASFHTFFERLPSGAKSAAKNFEVMVRFRMYWLFSGMGCAIPFTRRTYEQASNSNAAISK
jgi:hypothetical protein